MSRTWNISSARTITAVPAVRYRERFATAGRKPTANCWSPARCSLALVVVGTAFFFALAPAIANLGALYAATT